MNTKIIDSINRQTMRSVVTEYRWADDLQSHERAALSSILERVRGKRILDIGVGAGRTVKDLREVSEQYVGVDYVREMVDHCRERFPGVRFDHADARAMTQFAAESFDLIVFACNGICMVDHAGRLQILREVHRLLAPGGFFIFSTSNVNDPRRNRFLRLPPLEMSRNPAKVIARSARFVGHTGYRLFNRLRHRRQEVRTDDKRFSTAFRITIGRCSTSSGWSSRGGNSSRWDFTHTPSRSISPAGSSRPTRGTERLRSSLANRT